MKTVLKEEFKKDADDRRWKCQVFLRNLPQSEDDSFIFDICTHIGSAIPCDLFRLKSKGEGIRLLIFIFDTPRIPSMFIRYFGVRKRGGSSLLSSFIVRPNYSADEERIFHEAWACACAKNDTAGRKKFIVKDFKVVKLDKPGEWVKRDRPTRK